MNSGRKKRSVKDIRRDELMEAGWGGKQGQVIASSGCTGHCFGPHVHFETRVNGSPVDPMGYL